MPSLVKTIAKELGISTASVSRALNDQPGLGEELRSRILERAALHKGGAHMAARGLASAKTFTLGFFIRKKRGLSTYSDPFYGEILHGVEEVVNGSNYHLAIASLDDEMLETPEMFRYVREQRVDGMILAGPDIPAEFILSMLYSGLPVVLIDNVLDHSPAHAVTCDDEGGATKAARYLLDLGHTQIGVIAGPDAWASNRRRIRAYERVLAERGLTPVIVRMDETTIDSGTAAYDELLARAPEITAIGAVNDSMAIGAMIGARRAGRRIPNDLSVIGFDNISWSALHDPALTTIDVPTHQLGIEAARRLLSLLSDSAPQPATQLTISVSLVERASCTLCG